MDIIDRAHLYVVTNTVSGADAIILELCEEVVRLRKSWGEDIRKLLDQVKVNNTILTETSARVDAIEARQR